jgi:hypothetical protein
MPDYFGSTTYQGSKRNLAPVILRYFPKGIKRLVEPFAGSAAMSVAAAAQGLAKSFWINDLNGNRDARYYSGISHEGFVEALEGLTARKLLFIISYDGMRGDKTFGEFLPDSLELTRIEIEAGRSSQSTLLGLHEVTFESLYLSPALMERLDFKPVAQMERGDVGIVLARYTKESFLQCAVA